MQKNSIKPKLSGKEMKKVLLLLLLALLPMVVSLPIYAFDFKSGVLYYNIGNNKTVSVVAGDVKYSGNVVIPSQVSYNGTIYTVTSIGDEAFKKCVNLMKVNIGNGLTWIGKSAFSGCNALTSITIPNSVTSIGERAFWGCSCLESVNIPDKVTCIENYTFSLCYGLTSVTIPSSVMRIGDYAFSYCGLTSIISPNRIPPSCGNSSFYSVNADNCLVWVPKGAAAAYGGVKDWKSFENVRYLSTGDLDINGVVDKNDFNALVDYIMDKKTEGFYESLTDLNADTKTDAADVVLLVDLLCSEGLSTDCQVYCDDNDGKQVISSLQCTLKNNRNETIELTSCDLYLNDKFVKKNIFTQSSGSLNSGSMARASFVDLKKQASRIGFSIWWHYKSNGKSFVYRYDITN